MGISAWAGAAGGLSAADHRRASSLDGSRRSASSGFSEPWESERSVAVKRRYRPQMCGSTGSPALGRPQSTTETAIGAWTGKPVAKGKGRLNGQSPSPIPAFAYHCVAGILAVLRVDTLGSVDTCRVHAKAQTRQMNQVNRSASFS